MMISSPSLVCSVRVCSVRVEYSKRVYENGFKTLALDYDDDDMKLKYI